MSTLSETQAVKDNLENIKNELSYLLLHKDVLEYLIEDCKKVFESKIVIPNVTRNLKMIGDKDLSIDLVPLVNATKEQVMARYNFYHYSLELADTIANIEVKKDLYKEYQEHLRQFFIKQGTKITDEMIYEKYKKAESIKDFSPEEKKTFQGIAAELPQRIAGDKQMRLELYESLQNLILQHG
jgi:hypothetical protein